MNLLLSTIWNWSQYRNAPVGFISYFEQISSSWSNLSTNRNDNISNPQKCTIRLANITLRADQNNLDWYQTHNGGFEPESFRVFEDIGQHLPKSLIQSRSTGLGVTQDGYIAFGGSDN